MGSGSYIFPVTNKLAIIFPSNVVCIKKPFSHNLLTVKIRILNGQ